MYSQSVSLSVEEPTINNPTDSTQFLLDLSMAVGGLLMFGDGILDEVTSNILKTDGYSRGLSVCIVIFVAIIPLTKIPLKYVTQPCVRMQTCFVLPCMLTPT